jgi:general secretion pathway protein G
MFKSLKSGFSLMEIMIAIAIMGMLAGVGIPMYFSYIKNASITKTNANLAMLKNEVNRYHADTGKYPRSLDDLVDKPDSDDPIANKWSGPYIDVKGGKLPEDGWNQEFYYEVTSGGMRPFELYSYGPEGEDGPEEQRINAW